MTSYLDNLDLSLQSPPYLEKTFTQLRTQMAEQTADPVFREWLDNEALPWFLRKVENAYFTLIYQSEIPAESLGLENHFIAELKRKNEFTRLARLLARWNVEIELSVDIIERACLYGLYVKPCSMPNINDDIRKNWGLKDASMMKRCVFRILNFAAYSTAHLSAEVVEHTSERLALNLASLKTTALTSLLYMFMGSGFPIALMHVIGAHASVAIGGYVASKAGEKVHSAFDNYALHNRLKAVDSQLETILTQLTYTNTQAANAITLCHQTHGAEQHLKRLIGQLLVHRASVDEMRASQMEETFMLENIRVTEEDDYLLVELVEPDFSESIAKPI